MSEEQEDFHVVSFRPTDEEQAFVEMAGNLANNKIRSLITERNEWTADHDEVIQQMRELGLLDLELPESWGGMEFPLVTQVQILRTLGYGDLDFIQGLPGAGDAASLFRLLPENRKTNRCRERFLSEEMNTVAFVDTVRSSFSAATPLQLKAEGHHYILTGQTPPVRLGEACNLVIISLVDPSGKKRLIYLEDPESWKVSVENRLGLDLAKVASFHFDQVEIPGEQVLASGKEAEDILLKARARIQILQAAKEVGLAQAALDYATEYTATRKAFGRYIAQFQGVSFQIAKMAIEIQAANHLVLAAALEADKGHRLAIPYAFRGLNRAHRALRFATDRAVQLLGGYGYIREYPVEKWMRDAQAQVMLYGRERELLHEYGQWLVADQKEVTSV